jgi:DnaJ-class molecular chaperone
MLRKDYYLILGVSRTESPRGIRAAFCELAKRYHPERIGPQGMHFFQELLTAYQVLSDSAKRQHYSQDLSHAEGKATAQDEFTIVEAEAPPVSTVPEPISVLRDFATICPPYEEMLERVRRNFARPGVPHEEPVKSFNVQVLLSPAEAARGGMAFIAIPVFYPCPACGGSGRDWLFPCSACQEQGVIEEEETIRAPIPAMVRDYTLVEAPVRGLGIHNLCLRLYIRVMA